MIYLHRVDQEYTHRTVPEKFEISEPYRTSTKTIYESIEHTAPEPELKF